MIEFMILMKITWYAVGKKSIFAERSPKKSDILANVKNVKFS
jgi:hypothetical protein